MKPSSNFRRGLFRIRPCFTTLNFYLIPMANKKKVALVLGSGGSRGLAHIGVIQELESRGYEISSISGASIGSVVGGVYAAGHLKEYADWIMDLDRRKVFSLMDFTLSSHGFIKGERVFESMKKFVGSHQIQDLKIPFAAVSVDLENQEEVVFTEGDLWHAIRASVSIPSVLTPVIDGDRVLVDGGVVNPLPVNRVKRTEGDILIAVDLNALVPDSKHTELSPSKKEEENQERNKFLDSIRNKVGEWWPFNSDNDSPSKQGHVRRNYLGILNASFELMQDQVAQLAMQQNPPDILIQIPRGSASTFDFYLGDKLISMGRELAKNALNEYES